MMDVCVCVDLLGVHLSLTPDSNKYFNDYPFGKIASYYCDHGKQVLGLFFGDFEGFETEYKFYCSEVRFLVFLSFLP